MEATKANDGGTAIAGNVKRKATTRKWGGFPTLQALLQEGTPRQKAEVWAMGYMQFTCRDGKPEITPDQAEMIEESVMWPERDEFDRLRATYNAYVQAHKTVKMALLYFKEARERALGIYRLYKEMNRTQDTLDRIIKQVRGTQTEKTLTQTVQSWAGEPNPALTVKNGRIKVEGLAAMRKDLRAAVKEAGECLEDLKGVTTAIEEYASRTRTKSLMPLYMRDALKEARQDRVRETEPMFSKAELEDRKARGEDTSGMELAIFPDWEHASPSRDLYDNWREEIEELVDDNIKLLA